MFKALVRQAEHKGWAHGWRTARLEGYEARQTEQSVGAAGGRGIAGSMSLLTEITGLGRKLVVDIGVRYCGWPMGIWGIGTGIPGWGRATKDGFAR
jgi:hypothetical protein